jgi:TPR repeat protein
VSQIRDHRPLRHPWHHVRAALCVPPEGRFVLRYLKSEGFTRMVEELERLSSLGSAWAAAVLGCICLNDRADPDRAIELCEKHANNGDPYALFVYAWALLHKGQRPAAILAMERAAKLGFPPATLDFVTFVWKGWGVKERNPRAALFVLRRAFRSHHSAALIWLAGMYRSGQFGIIRCMAGWLLMPFARLRQFCALMRDPFSCRAFSLSTVRRRPIFKDP